MMIKILATSFRIAEQVPEILCTIWNLLLVSKYFQYLSI